MLKLRVINRALQRATGGRRRRQSGAEGRAPRSCPPLGRRGQQQGPGRRGHCLALLGLLHGAPRRLAGAQAQVPGGGEANAAGTEGRLGLGVGQGGAGGVRAAHGAAAAAAAPSPGPTQGTHAGTAAGAVTNTWVDTGTGTLAVPRAWGASAGSGTRGKASAAGPRPSSISP